MNLTRKQSELLSFIRAYVCERGIFPSYDEMNDGLGLNSKGSINRLLCALIERGYVRRTPGHARAFCLTADLERYTTEELLGEIARRSRIEGGAA